MWAIFLGCANPEDPNQAADIRASALAFLLKDAEWDGWMTACVRLLDVPPGTDEVCEPTAEEADATVELLQSRNYPVVPDEACVLVDEAICRVPVDAETGEGALRVGVGCPVAFEPDSVEVGVSSSAWTCDVPNADPYLDLTWSLSGWEVTSPW